MISCFEGVIIYWVLWYYITSSECANEEHTVKWEMVQQPPNISYIYNSVFHNNILMTQLIVVAMLWVQIIANISNIPITNFSP